ncbi:MAG: CocE/NonD family hydrolase [Candidatus Heimdallarchaeota archaeon]|nr:CocE/NonD family hydrolase [Candidatus Heimdallarchaeota archaeon]MCG3253752.1 CocE/NonD family hydrolase [Candidatus Heimdallarchaeota archaeon]MCK4290887.1 CocE/NonD family hydrolase [Candidatus Heimdallarchaeota archaeon]
MKIIEVSSKVKTRDGVNLATITVLPETREKIPAMLIRTPYSAEKKLGIAKTLVQEFNQGVVLQDCRGRFDSEGTFKVFLEKEDTLDTIAWIKQQNWFNGDLHIFGASYLGYVALEVLGLNEAPIKSVFAPTILGDIKDSIHRGGVLQLHWALPWAIMTAKQKQRPWSEVGGSWPENYDITIKQSYKKALEILGWPDHIWQLFTSGADNPIWNEISLSIGSAPLPKFCLVGAWYDFLLNATLSTYEWLTKKGNIQPDLIIGPWSHNGYLASQAGIESWEFGKAGKSNFIEDLRDFLLRVDQKSPQIIRTFILRSNKWMKLNSWPPENAIAEKRYLAMNNQLAKEIPIVEEIELNIIADYSNPIPTLGGMLWESFDPITPGPADQSPLRNRKDILRFISKPLESDCCLLGPIKVILWVKTQTSEAHFTAKLNFIDTEDKEVIIQEGIQRVLGPLEDFQEITIDLLATGIALEENEKLSLEISWSNYPKYSLPQIKENINQSIALGKNMPSYVILPFIKTNDLHI